MTPFRKLTLVLSFVLPALSVQAAAQPSGTATADGVIDCATYCATYLESGNFSNVMEGTNYAEVYVYGYAGPGTPGGGWFVQEVSGYLHHRWQCRRRLLYRRYEPQVLGAPRLPPASVASGLRHHQWQLPLVYFHSVRQHPGHADGASRSRTKLLSDVLP